MTEVLVALAAGALSTLNPCVFPLLPMVIGGAVQTSRLAPLAMGAGMVAAFALLGVLVGALGDAIGLDPSVIRTGGGVLLVVLGAAMLVPKFSERISLMMTPLATKAQGASDKITNQSLLSSFCLGAVLGFVWTPCSGPMLLSTLTLVATEGGLLKGSLLLGVFGLGAAVPLISVAYASRAGFMKFRDKLLKHSSKIKTVFGLIVMSLGAGILTGYDKKLEILILDLMPTAWIGLTTSF